MPHAITKTIAFLIFNVTLLNCGLSEDKKQVEVKLSIYPENVAFGDTCYVLVTGTNHSDDVAYVDPVNFQSEGFIPVHFSLTRQRETWRGTFENQNQVIIGDLLNFGNTITIPCGETVAFLATPLQFPPLEDLYQDDFWVKKRKELVLIGLLDLKDHQKKLDFDFEIEFPTPYVPGKGLASQSPQTHEVMIKLRNEKEMAMIDQWYRNTPSDFFPVIVDGRRYFPGSKNPEKYLRKVPPQGFYRQESGKKILDQTPWQFMNIDNRYPGDPNVPTTWQGWKKLEENITPSTMRDEIHLTRIMVQYSATKRAAVLKELKDWFANMNEIQRTVMAKSLRDRAVGAYGTNLLPPFREVYKAIREYDVVPIPEGSVKHLRDIGLIE